MLVNSGWDYEKGLGVDGQGTRHPVATRLKHDRLALGAEKTKKVVTHTFEEIEKSRAKPTAKVKNRTLTIKTHHVLFSRGILTHPVHSCNFNIVQSTGAPECRRLSTQGRKGATGQNQLDGLHEDVTPIQEEQNPLAILKQTRVHEDDWHLWTTSNII